VLVEGLLAIDNLDVVRDAPGQNVAKVITYDTFVTDGTITIDFATGTSDPSINAIEVIHTGPIASIAAPMTLPGKVPTKLPTKTPAVAPMLPPATAGTLVHRINCGATNQVIVPPSNVVWNPDQYASSGLSYSTCGNTTTGSIYCTSRYFRTQDASPFRYNLPVPVSNRTYEVRLHFAEQVSF
jgi:Malectin domain